MAARPSLFTRGLSSLAQSAVDADSPSVSSPAEQRGDAKRNFLKTMRPLPTQHYWHVYFDRAAKDPKKPDDGTYQAHLEQIGHQIESVQDFWRFANNTPVEQIKMRESLYLFKAGYKPIWEDRRNVLGGSWTFRVSKEVGPDLWTRIQLLAIGERLQSVLEEGDQICGVGLSVRFNAHVVTIWHRDASKQKSIDGMLKVVLEEVPSELLPKSNNYFYKKHSEHAGFNPPAELRAVVDSQLRAQAQAASQATTQAGLQPGQAATRAATTSTDPQTNGTGDSTLAARDNQTDRPTA